MAAVALVRKIDCTGKMSVPVDFLRGLNISYGDEVDITAADRKIISRKHEPEDITADIKSLIRKYESDGTYFNIIKALEKVVKEAEKNQ